MWEDEEYPDDDWQGKDEGDEEEPTRCDECGIILGNPWDRLCSMCEEQGGA